MQRARHFVMALTIFFHSEVQFYFQDLTSENTKESIDLAQNGAIVMKLKF